MRLFMDFIVALMLTALLGGIMWYNRTDRELTQMKGTAQTETLRFQQQIALQSALAKVPRNERGYPDTIDPDWFQGDLPQNPLLDAAHPWVEIAGLEQKDLVHPQERVATDGKLAKFWYNPHLGIVRARVPAGVSDQATLETYNFVNDTALPELFANGSSKR